MPHTGDLKGFLIFLVAAGIIVPFFHRARIGTVLGFLLVGVALGPFGLGRLVETYPWLWYATFDEPERAQPAAELGIIFLLFLLGLELSLERLWQLRVYVFGVGAAQVALSALAIGLIAGWSGAQAPIVLGLCLALSSTAIVMQLLIEQGRSATQLGRVALSVLLFDGGADPVHRRRARPRSGRCCSVAGQRVCPGARRGRVDHAGRALRGASAAAFRRPHRQPGSHHGDHLVDRDQCRRGDRRRGALGCAWRLSGRLAAQRKRVPPSHRSRSRAVQGSPARHLLHHGGDEHRPEGRGGASRLDSSRCRRIDRGQGCDPVRRRPRLQGAARRLGGTGVAARTSRRICFRRNRTGARSRFAVAANCHLCPCRGRPEHDGNAASGAAGEFRRAAPGRARSPGSCSRRGWRGVRRPRGDRRLRSRRPDDCAAARGREHPVRRARRECAAGCRASGAGAARLFWRCQPARNAGAGRGSQRACLRGYPRCTGRRRAHGRSGARSASRRGGVRPRQGSGARGEPGRTRRARLIPETVEASLQLGARVLEALGLPEEAVAQRIEEARDEEVGRLERRSE